MALRKDKKKVLGETFDDDRVRSFLEYQPVAGENPDYHVLEKAYRGMKEDNFATFVKFFKEDGRDINARNANDETLLQVINRHRHAEGFIQILKDAGAK